MNSPLICLLERGEHNLRRTHERGTAELVVKDVVNYEMVQGLLGRKVRSPDGYTIVVPVIPMGGACAINWNGKRRVLDWRSWILHVLHNSTAGGHVAMPALAQRVMEVAWWPRLSRDCEAWTRKCVTCRVIKGQPHGSASWRSERYTSPFRVLQVDLVGPLEPASDSNAYILTVIDCFSLWLWLVGLADKRPATVAQALYCQVYLVLAGFPVILRSDNGSEFVAELTMELNRLIGTTQVFGSAYHPRSQALIEGCHKPMEEVLQAYIDEYPNDWASKLPVARWAWNTSAKVSLAGIIGTQKPLDKLPEAPKQRAGDFTRICRGIDESHRAYL